MTGKLKFLIVGVDYFTNLIEDKVLAKIPVKKVCCFYRKKIMYRVKLSGFTTSDNETQLSSTLVIEFYCKLGV